MSSDTPSDTPRTTSFLSSPRGLGTGYYQAIDFARQLERELSAARSDLECQGQAYSKALDDLAAANKRLEAYRVECRARGLIGVVAAIDGKEGES